MSKTQLVLEVSEPDSHIEWEFETKCRDIGFSLLYKKNSFGPSTELIPKQRIETVMSAETGMFKCEELGICKYRCFILLFLLNKLIHFVFTILVTSISTDAG